MTDWLLLPDAIALKWGAVADTACTADSGRVTSWRHPSLPEPTEAELVEAIAEFVAANSPLEQARSQALAVLNDACRADVVAGVVSNALGSEHLYGSDEKDQANLLSSILVELPVIPYTCTEVATGLKEMRTHTLAQFKVLLQDAALRRIGLQQKYEALRVMLEQAETLEQIESVRW